MFYNFSHKNIFRNLFISLLAVSFIYPASASQSSFTCRGKNIVERAGVALVKCYTPGTNDYAVLVGVGAHNSAAKAPFVNFFAGRVDPIKDRYSTQTAVRELHEETGGGVKGLRHASANPSIRLKSSDLVKGKRGYYGYVYSGDNKPRGQTTRGKNYIQLFFWRDDNLSVAAISKLQAAAINNRRLPHDYREVKQTVAIPLQDLLNRARQISKLEKSGKDISHPSLYILKTRGDGRGNNRMTVRIDGHYMRNLARDLKTFESICYKISNGKVR